MNKAGTRSTPSTLFGLVKNYALRILLETIPTFLLDMLYVCFAVATRLSSLLHMSPKKEVDVYDLLNCGVRNRFALGELIVHNCQYGAGAGTVHGALTRKEIDIEFEEVAQMHHDYWSRELFAVVREYEAKLKREWHRNNGWIKNCLGWPTPVSEEKLKDLLNRNIQSSAHGLLTRLLRHIDTGRREERVPMWPVLPDYYDETIWEVEESAAEHGLDIFRKALVKLNDGLGWEIKIRGEPQLADNLAQIKCQD